MICTFFVLMGDGAAWHDTTLCRGRAVTHKNKTKENKDFHKFIGEKVISYVFQSFFFFRNHPLMRSLEWRNK